MCYKGSKINMSASSLVKLSASAIIHQEGSLVEGCDLSSLPRNLVQELLESSICHSRILCLRSLITNWPLEHLVLQNALGFDEPKAVLLAYLLQRSTNNLRLVDIRGCKIGLHGTTAFCKLAVNLPVSDNDVSGMKILDMRPAPNSIQQKAVTQPPKQGRPPLVVMFDAEVCQENHAIATQACKSHTFMDLKMSHVTMYEMRRGVKDILSLLTCLEPEVTTGLDLTRNSLLQCGMKAIAPAILPLINLTDLNLSYNVISYRHTDADAVQQIANICSNLTKLKKLDLSGNYMKAGVCVILRCVTSNLVHLGLGGCVVGKDNLREMCSMETLNHLQSLNLDCNGLGNCVNLLCNFILKSARTLEHLSIAENMFVTSSVPPLCQMVGQLQLLKTLSLCYNHFLPEDIMTFREQFLAVEIINRDWLY